MVRRWFHRRRNTKPARKFNIRFFRLDELRIATKNFSTTTLLGSGGFGTVFKGILPDDGRLVAIKRNISHRDGFLEMVELMSSIRHINLIQVIGCCIENGEQLLVCEFAENNNVSEYLHGENRPAFDWETRSAICIGIARGLSYLHEEISPRIIHRDIKPSNILLGANFVPKIADFDLMDFGDGVKVNSGSECPYLEYTSTYTTTVKGTLAYLDPSYVLKGNLTEKVDVYSFGVVMLEIITGRRAFVIELNPDEADGQMILIWVTRMRKEGLVLKIVDPKLTDFPQEVVERFINVALLCTRANSEERPNMFQVVHMLYGGHKSDQEISEMATTAIADIADQPSQWSNPASLASFSCVFMDSVETDDVTAEMRSGEEAEERNETANVKSDSPVVENINDVSGSKGECSSSKENQSSEDVVREYFERSMEKIMRYQVEKRNNRTKITMKSEHMFLEAVYPPFLSGEYRTARVLYSQRPE